MRNLGGKRVLVTGGVSGIGLATTRRFVAEGARVAVFDRDGAGCARLRDSAAAPELVLELDVSDVDAVTAGFARIDERWNGLDVLINNAGISTRHGFLDITPAEWRAVLATNLDGLFHVAQAAARRMVRDIQRKDQCRIPPDRAERREDLLRPQPPDQDDEQRCSDRDRGRPQHRYIRRNRL
jgi:NAD(P)-dependent dehydrogenase (short-subunit alcohol dehydrogenase family)